VRSTFRTLLFLLVFGFSVGAQATETVERWSVFETSLKGPGDGNPFMDVTFGAVFRIGHRSIDVDGFYDGDGQYRVRFMPDATGVWSFTTRSNRANLSGKTGTFRCIQNTAGNHGPVSVRNTWHFGYSDDTPYVPIGTTAYAWVHQGDELEEQTLRTLKSSPFNKIRMCVFPKDYVYNKNEPKYYPFPRDAAGTNDYSQFNPDFFQHIEKRLRQLMTLGIEADLILFHPYDRWGYKEMPAEVNDRYLRYTVARFSAFRNVWWSMANEWDFMKSKTQSDFDHYFQVVQQHDAYQHLRSIHNGSVLYDHSKPWVTHVSIQGDDFVRTPDYLSMWKKPVVWDECKYEGNIPRRWGDISAEEMVRRFWLGTALGSYVGHGETYLDPNDILWWSRGGVLHGQSPKRIRFLRDLIQQFPPEGINPLTNQKYPAAAREGEFYLFYFDLHQPAEMEFELPATLKFTADIIDPWQMTITPTPGSYSGKFTLKLPGKPGQAVRFRIAR
jgi:hypothetical protein